MSNNKLETMLTPVGEITFMAVSQPVKKFSGEGMEYVVRLQYDANDSEAKTFRSAVEKLNSAKIVAAEGEGNSGNTENSRVPTGKFQVSFKTSFTREDGTLAQPTVLDADGNKLSGDNIPQFYSDTDSGSAKVEAAISTSGKRPTLYLRQVAIMEFNQGERPEATVQESELMAALKATHNKNAANG